jgi:hypothetical protein
VAIVTKSGANDRRDPPVAGAGSSTLGAEGGRAPDGDGVVGLGDEHVSGVESLCIGESQ